MRKGLLILLMVFLALSSQAFQNLDSLETALETAQGKDRVDVLNKLYIVYNRLNPTKALEQSILALELANEIEYPNGRAAALNNIGVIYKNQGVYDEALEYYIESLRISTEIDDKKAQASTLNNLGTVYSLKKTYDKALIYFIESYDIFKALGANGSLIDAINNIGNAYMEMGREDLALDYYSEAMALSSKDGTNSEGSSNSLNNVGNVYYFRGDYNNALLYYQRALSLEIENGNMLGTAYSKSNLAATHIAIKDYKRAKTLLDSALITANELSAYPLLEVIYMNQSKLYYETKDYKKAYESRVLYDQSKDFVFNDASSRMMAQMEVAVELQEKEKELQRLRKDQQIQSLQIENSRIVIILGVMGSIVLLAAGFIFLKLRKKTVV